MSDIEDHRQVIDLFYQYYRLMVITAFRYVHNLEDAEDVVSECWVSILQHEETLAQMEERIVKAYILQCVRHRSIDFLRRQKRFPTIPCLSVTEDLSHLCDQRFSSNEVELSDESSISLCISRLPPREAQVVKMKLEGHDTKSIAQFMEIGAGTVRKYWFKAKRRIRVLLDSQADN